MRHNIVDQLLKEFNISIFAGNNQILHSESTSTYPTSELNSFFTLHKHVSVASKSLIRIENYQDLIKLGFHISKRRVKGKEFYGQKIEYFLLKLGGGYYNFGSIPPEHVVEYNTVEHWIRLVGRNSTGKKVMLYPKRGTYNTELVLEDYSKVCEDYLNSISPFTYQAQEQRIPIPEIPVLLTDDGRLVCLPHTKDLPKIGIFGATGKGKTLVTHLFADCVYWKWKKRCAIMNDSVSFQTKSWQLPWDELKHREFFKGGRGFPAPLELIDHKTRPLSCVYIFQNTSDLIEVELENESSFRTTLPFRDIISHNPAYFFDGVEDLSTSGKYLNELIYTSDGKLRSDGLMYIQSIQDILNLINEQTIVELGKISDDKTLIEKQIVYKIKSDTVRGKFASLFQEMLNSKFFDINTNIPSKWIVQKNDLDEGTNQALYPWRACLYCDLVPVFVTSHLVNDKYFPSYYRFVLDDLFKMQQEPLNKKNETELWLFIDEIHTLLQHAVLFSKLREIAKQSRPNRIGIIYATQYFGDISPDIELITDYIISFQQTAAEGKRILDNFDSMKHMVKIIKMLPKFHAVIAGRPGNPLVIYDTEGNKETVDDGTPFKGIIFPSVSQHLAPKREGI